MSPHHFVGQCRNLTATMRAPFRDLKPEHIMFDSRGNLRLVDFFSATIMGEDSLISREGTLAYMAPEMVGKPSPDELFSEVCKLASKQNL